ncbi:dTDP-4-dehydrorhamnose 3,5-epimerase [Candidatus Levibacter sp. Uisw_134_01]|uniref:dTDP-4-dehydrorhamnose 3,5-epimerase n=1 Tax=Candidatus Levibacter sp. Uisw_134_01 TaxID=3230999 RepID=UPI003D4376D2
MSYKVTSTILPEVLILEPKLFEDERGFFFESFNKNNFQQATGVKLDFVQDNHSRSKKNVLRGLHYQIQHAQGKLVRVTFGAVFDVVVDMRCYSPRFGKWVGVELTAENKRQLWVPSGFAHGFLVISDIADFQYKTTDYWYPEYERCLLWNDPEISINWPLHDKPKLGAKDNAGKKFTEADFFK